jgi:FkbM family methyltransferase
MTTRWFRVNSEDVVVDVGAHIGRYALIAARNASKVVAVEPDPSNFQLLQRNVSLNGFSNVVLIPKALSSVAGTRPLVLAGKENTGTSRLVSGESAVNRSPDANSSVVSVETETLDQLVDANGLTRIDWLKIDVEGHEIAVLQGGESALRITRRLALEVTDTTQDRCRRILESAGFGIDSVEKGDPASNWLMSKRIGCASSERQHSSGGLFPDRPGETA